MAERLQRWLEARWWCGARVPIWLRVASRLFAVVSSLRRGLYRRGLLRTLRLPAPVIVVGNLTVGGSGKTPVVIALAEALRAAGLRPGVISRGYGRHAEAGDDPLSVTVATQPGQGGDEPVLIARRTGVPVVVSRDRVAAGRHLLARHEVDVIVTDDGLQHYRLARDVEIVVVDGRRRFGNGMLLPAGPLREPTRRLHEVDAVLINGDRAPGEAGFDLALADAEALAGGGRRSLASFAGGPVHAVAGIGDPARFFGALRDAGLDVIEHAFPDHHAFAPADLAFGDGAPVLMTEKDAVKCRAFARPHWYALPVSANLHDDVLAGIIRRIQPSRHSTLSLPDGP